MASLNEMDPQRIFLVMVGYSCNNHCIICSNKPRVISFKDRSTEEIKRDIKRGKEGGYQRVEFTGGEPTIRPDFLDLLKYAKKLNFREIAVSTNGRLFSYGPFCEKVFSAGLNRVTLTIYGPNKQIHDSITRTPHSFDQTIRGAKNIIARKNTVVTANTVPSKINYPFLKETGLMILDLGIHEWSILDLIPDGYAKKFYKSLVIDLNKLSSTLNSLTEIIDNFLYIQFFDFPLCLFSEKTRNDPKTRFVTAKGRLEITKQIGYEPKRFQVDDNSSYQDCHKETMNICKNCLFSNECAGIWNEYNDLYGNDSIVKMAKKNKCLKL